MKRLLFALFVLAWSARPALAAELKLTIHDGLVSIDAQDVTLHQILTEWARVGQTHIVNIERITGGPVSLKLEDVPEKQALDIILRSIPGYMALPRATLAADASVYDRILIMATTTQVVAAPRSRQPAAAYSGMQMMPGAPGGPNVTQLRPMPAVPLMPGALPDSPNAADPFDDPAIANAAAAGLIPVPALNPGAAPGSSPLTFPGAPTQPQTAPSAPGIGAPTNPWGVPVGTAQPSLAPPEQQAPQPASRVRPPQPD